MKGFTDPPDNPEDGGDNAGNLASSLEYRFADKLEKQHLSELKYLRHPKAWWPSLGLGLELLNPFLFSSAQLVYPGL